LSRAFRDYVSYPSSANARAVVAQLPARGRVAYTGSDAEAGALALIDQELGTLECQVRAQEPDAVRLAFRLMTVTDGALLESLHEMLGRLIRPAPRLFLQQLAENEGAVGELDGLVGNFGTEYVDRVEAQRLETRLRVTALASVRDRRLRRLRDRCIASLQR